MRAEDQVIHYLKDKVGLAEADRLVASWQAEHAHQLAERQREAIAKTDDPVYYQSEAGWLPDLIDPAAPPG